MARREPLTSRTSPQVTAVRGLHTARGRREAGAFLVEGPQGVREALEGGLDTVFVTAEAATRWPDLVAAAHDREVPVLPVTESVLDAMAETSHPQGILAVCTIPTTTLDDLISRNDGPVVVLDQVSDPGNAGTIIRTADAVGAAGVVMVGDAVDPYNGKCVRSTAGSIFHLPIVVTDDPLAVIERVRAAGLGVIAATGDGELDLLSWTPVDGRLCWVFGSEAHGVSDAMRGAADARVRIPVLGQAESLNVASAAAVCLYADVARHHGRIEHDLSERIEAR